MDIFKNIGNFFNGLFGKKKEEQKPQVVQQKPVTTQSRPTAVNFNNQPKAPSILQPQKPQNALTQPKQQTPTLNVQDIAKRAQNAVNNTSSLPKPEAPKPTLTPQAQGVVKNMQASINQPKPTAPVLKPQAPAPTSKPVVNNPYKTSPTPAIKPQTPATQFQQTFKGLGQQQQKAFNDAVDRRRAINQAQSKALMDSVNIFSKDGFFGTEQRRNFNDALRGVRGALDNYDKFIDRNDKTEHFDWGDINDYGRFIAKLPSGIASGLIDAPGKFSEAITGRRVDPDTGEATDINAVQRAGSLLEGTFSTIGLAFGGSKALLQAPFKKGGFEGVKNTMKRIAKDAGTEGIEELVQNFAGDLSDDGKINSDWKSYRDSLGLGMLGGGVMSGAGKAISGAKGAIRNPYRNEAAQGMVPKGGKINDAITKALTGEMTQDQALGKLSRASFKQHNEIQSNLGRPGLKDRRVWAEVDNLTEHAQRRFSENPTQEGYAKLVNSTDNALFGKGKEVIANRNNPYNALHVNKNDPSGGVAIGQDLNTGRTEMRSMVPMSKDRIERLVNRNESVNGLSGTNPAGNPTIPNSDQNVNDSDLRFKNPIDGFNASGNQVNVATVGDVNFVIGDYGLNAQNRKIAQNKPDRFDVKELQETLKHVKGVYNSGDTSFRKDNMAIVSEMPDGEKRVIYTRKNRNGDEEIINFHKISTPNYEDGLKSYGTPAWNRTRGFGLEHLAGNPSHRSIDSGADIRDLSTSESIDSSYHSNSNIPNSDQNVKYKKQSQSVIYSENDQYSPEANAQIEKLSREYDPIINEELESNAEKHIAELGLADAHYEAMQALGKKNITPQEKANALKTLQTLGEQSDTASLDRFAELSTKLAETSRSQAQLLQLNRILRKQTPTGMLNSAVRSIERAGGEVTPETTSAIKDLIDDVKSYDPKISELQDKIESIYAQDDYSSKIQKAKQGLDNLKSQISSAKDRNTKINLEAQAKILDGRIKSWKKQQDTITDQKIAEIRGLAKELNGLVDEQGYASSRLGNFISEQSPSENKFGAVYRASLLSSLKTQTKNLVSNASNLATNKVTDLIAKPIDSTIGMFTGKKSISASNKGVAQGAIGGLKQSAHLLKTGEAPNSGQKVYETANQGETHFKNKALDKTMGSFTRGVFRVVEAGDKPFRNAMKVNTLYQEAAVDGANRGLKGKELQLYVERSVANPTADLLARAETRGADVVFGARNVLSDGVNKIQQRLKPSKSDSLGVKASKKLGQTILDVTMPFVKVPTNVAIKGFYDYTPTGAVVEAMNAYGKIKSKNFTQADQAKFARAMARSLIGVGAVRAGFALAEAGLITGAYPEDEKEKARWEAEGITPNSIKVGDSWVQVGPLSILFQPALMGVNTFQRAKDGADMFGAYAGAQLDALNALKDLPVLTGVKDMIELAMGDNYGNPGLMNMNGENAGREMDALSNFLEDKFLSLIVPNFVRSVASATDDKVRQTEYGNAAENFASRIPGLRQTLPEKVDVFGNKLENQGFVTDLFDPFSIKKSRQIDNEMYAELDRLKQSVGEVSKDVEGPLNAWRSRVKQSSGIKDENGENIKFNSSQRVSAQEQIGKALTDRYKAVMSTSEYQEADDQKKYDMLTKAASKLNQKSIKQGVLNGTFSANNPVDAYDMYVKDYKLKVVGEVKDEGGKFGALEAEAKRVDNKDIAKQAVSLFKDEKYSSIPDEIKQEYLKRNGISNDKSIKYNPGGTMADENGLITPVDYAIAASYDRKSKMGVVQKDISKLNNRQEMLNYLANGRRKSISGNYWVTTGMLDDLYKQGVISKSERNNLKNIKDISASNEAVMGGSSRGGKSGGRRKSGSSRAKSGGSGGSGKTAKVTGVDSAVNSLSDYIAKSTRQGASISANPSTPKFTARAKDYRSVVKLSKSSPKYRKQTVRFK